MKGSSSCWRSYVSRLGTALQQSPSVCRRLFFGSSLRLSSNTGVVGASAAGGAAARPPAVEGSVPVPAPKSANPDDVSKCPHVNRQMPRRQVGLINRVFHDRQQTDAVFLIHNVGLKKPPPPSFHAPSANDKQVVDMVMQDTLPFVPSGSSIKWRITAAAMWQAIVPKSPISETEVNELANTPLQQRRPSDDDHPSPRQDETSSFRGEGAVRRTVAIRMDSVKRKRSRMMNKHKHRKKLKETRYLRRKLKKA